MLQTGGNRWKWQRLKTKMRNDPERASVGGCWESDRQCYGPCCSPREEAIKNLSASAEFGGRCEASARELGDVGDALDANVSYSPFCLFPLFALASGHGRRGGRVPPAACGWAPWAELLSAAWEGRSGQGCSPGESSPRSLTRPSTAGCRAWKAATNHRSLTGCFSVSVSVVFTFFDLWAMKCFPEERVSFEIHILKVLYSINGLVFLSYLSQTP